MCSELFIQGQKRKTGGYIRNMGMGREIFIMKFNNNNNKIAAQPYYRFLSLAVLDKIIQDKILHDKFLKH
jgi:hypothetical protein